MGVVPRDTFTDEVTISHVFPQSDSFPDVLATGERIKTLLPFNKMTDFRHLTF